jgi:hypothetical protein
MPGVRLFFPHLDDLHIDKVEDCGEMALITERSRTAEAACHRRGLSSIRSTAATDGGSGSGRPGRAFGAGVASAAADPLTVVRSAGRLSRLPARLKN